MKSLLKGIYPLAALFVLGCDSGTPLKSSAQSQPQPTQTDSKARIQNALSSSGVLLPSGSYGVSEDQALADESRARKLAGDRGVFSDMYKNQGITLLPLQNQASFSLNEANADIMPVDKNAEIGGGGVAQCVEAEEKKICATACATATATAYAFAFAHASATACAWAQAWACAFTFRPFNQVCSWANSQACVTSFSSAFSAAFATDTQTACDTQCNK